MLRLLIALLSAFGVSTSLAESPAQPLSGPWTVSVGASAKGTMPRSVRLPYVVNATGFTGRRGVVSYRGSVASFRKRFTVPADGDYVLRFESVHHRATIWLDGRLVRRHTGAYLPFEVHARLAAGRRHTPVVRADWRDPTAM